MTDNISTEDTSSTEGTSSDEASGAGEAPCGAATRRAAPPRILRVPTVAPCLLLLAFGLVACQPGENRGRQSGETVDTAAVKSTLDSLRQVFISAYEAGDAEKNASLWTEDIRQATPFSPPVRGRDTIKAMNKRRWESNPATREITLDTLRDFRVLSEDWAYTHATWNFRVTPKDTGQTRTGTATYLVLYRKTPDGWKAHVEAGSPHSAPGE